MHTRTVPIPALLLIIAALLLTLTACGDTASAPDTPQEPAATSEEDAATSEDEAASEEDAATDEEDAATDEEPASDEEVAEESGSGGDADAIEALADVPTFPGVEPLVEGENTMADLTAGQLEQMLGEEVEAEIEAYSLPADATWDDVKAFYEEALSGDKWTYNTDISDETTEELKMVAWTTGGGFTKEQVIMVALVPDIMSENVALIVGFFSE